jgi:hypothetical protein
MNHIVVDYVEGVCSAQMNSSRRTLVGHCRLPTVVVVCTSFATKGTAPPEAAISPASPPAAESHPWFVLIGVGEMAPIEVGAPPGKERCADCGGTQWG